MLLRSRSPEDLAAANAILRESDHDGPARPAGPREPIPLETACPGKQAEVLLGGRKLKYWLVRRQLKDFAPDCLAAARQYSAVMRGARQNFDELEASVALCHVANMGPGDLLFMDTETCGLAGSAIFMVGLMSWQGDGLIFEQFVARDYSQEAAILAAFAERYGEAGALVTFNGKSFDMTMIRDRGAFHGVTLPEPQPPHLDLLHESRRRWRKQLPNCRLQTLERYLCGRNRVGDIPGADIPEAYHHFVKTGDATTIRDILHHNLLDLLTLAELVCAILTGCDPMEGEVM